jgi:hypothetical protein
MLIFMAAAYVLFGFYVSYAVTLHDQTTSKQDVSEMLMQVEGNGSKGESLFYKMCTSAYEAYPNENYLLDRGGDEVSETCQNIQTPELLSLYCVESAWRDVDRV